MTKEKNLSSFELQKLTDFRDQLAILRSIDADEFEGEDIQAGIETWYINFRNDPLNFFLCTAPDIQQTIWRIIIKRGAMNTNERLKSYASYSMEKILGMYRAYKISDFQEPYESEETGQIFENKEEVYNYIMESAICVDDDGAIVLVWGGPYVAIVAGGGIHAHIYGAWGSDVERLYPRTPEERDALRWYHSFLVDV